jgi:SPP1 gp7 family putative phage head morphogenesis protein
MKPEFLFGPVPHEEAVAWIRSKPAVSGRVLENLLPELRARAISIAGVEVASVVQGVRDRIAELPAGGDWEKIKKQIAEDISPFLVDPAAAPEQRDAQIQAATRRAELLLRMHGFQAYQASSWQVMDRQRDAFPYWQYLSQGDHRVRDAHAALDGKVLPADHEFWDTHFPPWDFGCRCQVVPVSAAEVEGMRQADAGLPPESRRVLEGPILDGVGTAGGRRLFWQGRTVSVLAPSETGDRSAFRWHPGDLRLDLAQLQARYDAPTWSAFESWARRTAVDDSGTTVWAWLGGEKPKPAPIIPAVAGGGLTDRDKIKAARFSSEQAMGGGLNTSIILQNGIRVVFKPGAGEYASQLRPGIDPGTQYKREKAASLIDEILGLGLVPATEIITHQGREGSAQIFKAGFKNFATYIATGRHTEVRRRLTERQRHDWQLFDTLVAHLDRHANNWMVRLTRGRVDLALIDNGLCLSRDPVEKKFMLGLEGLAIDGTNLDRLERFILREAEIRALLDPLIETGAVDHLFDRARKLWNSKTY